MKLLISLAFVLLNLSAYSQEWHSYFADDKVDIQIALFDKIDPTHNHHYQRVIFKYLNKTNEQITIRFNRTIAYDGNDLPVSSERQFTVVIPANGEVGYNDSTEKDKTYYIFSKDYKGMIKRSLTAFDIQNLIYL